MNRKKILIIAASALTAATIAVGGTLAYFTAQKTVTNTFTVGNVALTLDESIVDPDTWVKTGERTPDGQGNKYHLIYPGAVLPKDPQVTVTGGSASCYVRMIVSIPKIYISPNAKTEFDKIFTTINNNNWIYSKEVDTDANYEYYINYNGIVPKQDTDNKLNTAFDTITIPSALTNTDMTILNNFTMNIRAEAIQAQGFEDKDGIPAQQQAFDALSTALANAQP